MYAYVGSFNYQGSEGITICEFDPESGTITPKKLVASKVNAGSMTMVEKRLYSTDEQVMSRPEGGGGVLTFEADPATGELTEISHIYTMAANTSGITFDNTGKYMVVTHFAIGLPSIKIIKDGERSWHSEKVFPDTITSLYRMKEDGTPGELVDAFIHTAKGKPSFIHKAFLAPDGKTFGYGNLGSDEVGLFQIDYEQERIRMTHRLECKDFSGPRHLVFHPTLPYLYLNYERNGVISKFHWSSDGCTWESDTNILPDGVEMRMEFNQSEILIDKSGRRLYNLMRGLGMLYVMDIDQHSGDLSCLQMIETDSKVARGAAFSPDEKFLLLACNDTQNVVTYRVLEDGRLEKAAVSEKITHPASIAFLV